jgi:hypothetical protein
LYNDPRRKDLEKNQGLPAEWKTLVESALSLPGDNGRFALVFVSHLSNWFSNHYIVWKVARRQQGVGDE